MKVKDSLHELIHSLSKSEKRYYKLYASRHVSSEDSTMLALFDYIAKQPQYDEAALFHDFKGKALLNQFSTIKKRLYDQVLLALHAFHANNSVENQLNRMLHQATLLFEKSLYDQCERQLRSAEKLALKHDLSLPLISINKLKNRIVETRGYQLESNCLESLKLSTDTALSRERLLVDLWYVKSNLFRLLQRSGVAQTETDYQTIEQLLRQLPSAEFIQGFASVESTYLYNHIFAAYHFAKNEWTHSLAYTESVIAHLTENAAFLHQHPNTLISALTNACYLAEQLGQYNNSHAYLKQLKDLARQQTPDATEDLLIKLFSSRYSIELNLLTMSGQFQEAQQLSKEVLAGIDRFQEKITAQRKVFLLQQLAVTAFGCGNYHGSLQHINAILNDSKTDDQETLTVSAHLLNVVVHCELNNLDHLPYAIKQAKQALKATGRYGIAEQILLQGFLKVPKTHVLDIPELFSELVKQLTDIQPPNQLQSAYNFDFITWMEAKILNQSFAKKVNDKYRFMTSS
jgi:hypothetical protein